MAPGNELHPERWIEAHGDVLMGYAVARVRHRDVAEDLVQETFVEALRGRAQFQGRSSERTWLIAILKRKILDYYRTRWREQPATALSADEADDDLMQQLFDERGMWKDGKPQPWADPRRRLEVKELVAALNKCLAHLPPRLASVFVLREMEGLKGPQVCRELAISASNFWQLMHRARLRLRHCLERHGLAGPAEKGGARNAQL